jgi:mono/diheme cytochrome c family protein
MRKFVASIGVASMLVATTAAGQAARTEESRGELLYTTHCVSCHTTQVHWRDRKLATDWTSLKNQVRRWQRNIGLGLSEDDVAAIARYLNRLYYHFAPIETTRAGEFDVPRRAAARPTIPPT